MSIEEVVTSAAPAEGSLSERSVGARGLLRGFTDNKLAVIGLAVVLLALFCFVGPLLYHTNQINTRLSMETLPPGPGRPLGTDVGYDQLAG